MQKSALQLAVSACSHTGHVRAANQDAYGYSVEGQCFAVCDGMGGAAGGEVASRITIETFVERLALAGGHHGSQAGVSGGSPEGDQRTGPNHSPGTGLDHSPSRPNSSTTGPARRVEQAVAAANRILHARAQREPGLHGMGTTLVALILGEVAGEDRAWIAHVGDSRCYLLRGGTLRRCTEDHSLVEEQVRLGQMTPDEAALSPLRHVITRAVGVGKAVSVEIEELAVEPGDLFLLCTDGLTREVDEARLAEVLKSAASGEQPAAELAQALVAEALARAAADNITCLTVLVR